MLLTGFYNRQRIALADLLGMAQLTSGMFVSSPTLTELRPTSPFTTAGSFSPRRILAALRLAAPSTSKLLS